MGGFVTSSPPMFIIMVEFTETQLKAMFYGAMCPNCIKKCLKLQDDIKKRNTKKDILSEMKNETS